MNTNLLIIYIRNSRDIYALTEWLQNALLKKVNRGLTPSVEYLANSEWVFTEKIFFVA